jgi:hypothetical protein
MSESSRENGKLSHGPVTQEGKAAIRLNALKHGLRARTIILPGESQEEFDQLSQDLDEEWQPATPTERICLENMVVAQWKLIRAENQETWLHSLPDDDPRPAKHLAAVLQFEDRFERAFQRALRTLQRLQKDRRLASKEAAEAKAAKEAGERAEATPPPDPHPPIPPVYSTMKFDENGNPVVDIPGKLWNSACGRYQFVYDPYAKYRERLRPQFFPEPENPTPEADDEAA